MRGALLLTFLLVAAPDAAAQGACGALPPPDCHLSAWAELADPNQPPFRMVSVMEPDPAPRPRRLLLREIQVLERLTARGPRARGADYLHRLAQTHHELAQAEPVAAADARRAGTRALETIVRDYPNYGDMDLVLYELGITLSALGEPRAQHVFHRLFREYSSSSVVPAARAAFADFYLEDAQPADLNAAIRLYQRALQAGPHPRRGYLLYRLAWAQHTSGRADVAWNHFREALVEVTEPGELRTSLLRALALSYGGTAANAAEVFRRMAGEDGVVGVLGLARRFADEERWRDAERTLAGAQRVWPAHPDRCEWTVLLRQVGACR